MNIICEECGKIYQIDSSKLRLLMKDKKNSNFRCKVCGHGIPVSLSPEKVIPVEPVAPKPPELAQVFGDSAAPKIQVSMEPAVEEVQAIADPVVEDAGTTGRKLKFTMGIRSKMFLLFLVVPVLLILVFGYISNKNTAQMLDRVISQSADTITKQGEMEARKIARFVSERSYSYLLAHPLIKREYFNFDSEFKRIAVQKIGSDGYTMIAQINGQGGLTILAHPDASLVGINGADRLKKTLGSGSAGFYNIVKKARSGKESIGHFANVRVKGGENYVVITPVKGTSYSIIGITSNKQYTNKIEAISSDAQLMMDRLTQFNFVMMAISIVIIGLIISIYGHILTKKIRLLTDAADRISIGELDVEVAEFSGDEIGQLGESVARMQDSLRLSIERLRRRR